MEEKVLVKSEQYSPKKIRTLIISISAAIFACGLFLYLIDFDESRRYKLFGGDIITRSILDNMIDPWGDFGFFSAGWLMDFGVLAIIIGAFVAWCLSSYELTVSNKRIYGKTTFGKRVDLPVDSVSAVATSALNGIAVATSSGKIVFKLIKNRDEIHSTLSNLLIERQNKPAAEAPVIKNEIPQSGADELKKYKDLLDGGVISQEEFDAKKKQLLGL